MTFWRARGDIQLVDANNNPISSASGTVVRIRSTGYGKGRLDYAYDIQPVIPGPNGTYISCGSSQTASIDVYKTFTSTNTIIGPDCISPNQPVTFSTNPIVSTARQIAAEIGIDRYEWKINGVPLNALATIGWGLSYTSGDSSSITVTAPATIPGNPVVSVAIGRCNTTPVNKTLSTKANAPVFSGVVPSCIPTGNNTSFTLSVTNVPGVTYTWTNNAGWEMSAPTIAGGLNTVTFTPNGHAAEVTVSAKTNGGCDPAVTSHLITRQLTSGTNIINASTSCVTVGTAVTYTLANNVPGNSSFTWTAPAGWTPTTATGTSATFTPTALAQPGGAITVKTSTCAAGISVVPVFTNQGTTFTLTSLPCGLYQVNSPGFDQTGAIYSWYLDGVLQFTTTGIHNSYTYAPWTGTKTVSVTITKPNPSCLNATAALPNSTRTPCPAARIGSVEPAGTDLQSSVEVFPNPALNEVTLQLPSPEQVKEISLLDVTGKVRKRLNTFQTSHTLLVNDLPSGTYVLQVKIGKQLVTKKVILLK